VAGAGAGGGAAVFGPQAASATAAAPSSHPFRMRASCLIERARGAAGSS
jgi:hypothetical protein